MTLRAWSRLKSPPIRTVHMVAGFPVRTAKTFLISAVFVATLAYAQGTVGPNVVIRISSSLKTCFIADADVPCTDVGARLHAMKISADSDVHVTGDTDVKYELVHATMESLRRAGYRTKLGLLTN
jgi:biopolymer transport protein ExbD